MSEKETTPEESETDLGLSELLKNAVEHLENGGPKAFKAVKDYFGILIEKLKTFDIPSSETPTYDLFFERLNQMLPVFHNVVRLVTAIAEFEEQTKFYTEIHSFFEKLIGYFYFRNEGDSNQRLARDHYKVFGYELFLYNTAALLKYRRFEQLNELTRQGYYLSPSHRARNEQFISFNEFNQESEALTGYYGNKRVREEYIKSTFLKERIFETFSYEELAQADFILHFISILDKRNNEEYFYNVWSNQVYTEINTFELFVRSESDWFFEKFAKCLHDLSKDELISFLESYYKKISESGMYFRKPDWEYKINLKKLATRP